MVAKIALESYGCMYEAKRAQVNQSAHRSEGAPGARASDPDVAGRHAPRARTADCDQGGRAARRELGQLLFPPAPASQVRPGGGGGRGPGPGAALAADL